MRDITKTAMCFSTSHTLSVALMAIMIAGCSDTGSPSPVTSGPPNTMDSHNDDSEHAHPTEGPHHGDLIELGNEEYHAEILHDEDTGTVTIYVLDSAATKQVSIVASEVTINSQHDGNPTQFQLAASPDTIDPQGMSSRFVSNDEELAHHLDEEGAELRLVLKINGKSYRGAISHDHDHPAHNH